MNSFRNIQGKYIGTISGNIFEKTVKKSKHLFRKWDSWGIDRAVIDELVRDGVEKIIIHEKEEQIDYSVPVKDFIAKGFESNFGHALQVFLPRIHFSQDKANKQIQREGKNEKK